MVNPIKIGVSGPVGAGEAQLVKKPVHRLSKGMSIGVVTNDIYAGEDQGILMNTGVLSENRIIGAKAGDCPHTVIRGDASMNFATIDELLDCHEDIEFIFIESGGDNLTATFSSGLVDFSIHIIDIAQGEKISRKDGQGMIKPDYLITNKTDLVEFVGASLDRTVEDIKTPHDSHPSTFTNLEISDGLDNVIGQIGCDALLKGLA